MKVFYTMNDFAALISGGEPDRYPNEWIRKARTFLRRKDVRIDTLGRRRVVYLSSIRDAWSELYDSLQLEHVSRPSCAVCGCNLECRACDKRARRRRVKGESDSLGQF